MSKTKKNISDRTEKGFFKFRPEFKMVVCSMLAVMSFAARTFEQAGILFLFEMIILIIFCGFPVSIYKEMLVFIWQTVLITVLYLIRFQMEGGLLPGLQVSLQLFLAYFPGAILVKSVSSHEITNGLTRILPYRIAFVLSVSIRFFPLIIREIRTIYEVQLFRGASVTAKDLFCPWRWKDAVHALIVPMVIRSMGLSQEIALAAHARDFGIKNTRTRWPGNRGITEKREEE